MQKDQLYPITVKEIVRQYLGEHGYEGLYSDLLECGCALDNLMPCERFGGNPYACHPGYKMKDPSDEFEFLIGAEKEE